MITWACDCASDPAVKAAAGVAAVLRSAERPQDGSDTPWRTTLREAQATLIQEVQRAAQGVLWINSYVDLHPELETALRKACDARGIPLKAEDHYIHAAAGVALPQNDVDEIHQQIFKGLPPVGNNQSLTAHLRDLSDLPPIVKFSPSCGSLSSTPFVLEGFDGCWYVPILFANGRERGMYVHVSCPYHPAFQAEHIGAAGAYLFLAEGASLRNCLVGHIRSFLQAIAAAHLAAVQGLLIGERRRLREALAQRERPFRDLEKEFDGQFRANVPNLRYGHGPHDRSDADIAQRRSIDVFREWANINLLCPQSEDWMLKAYQAAKGFVVAQPLELNTLVLVFSFAARNNTDASLNEHLFPMGPEGACLRGWHTPTPPLELPKKLAFLQAWHQLCKVCLTQERLSPKSVAFSHCDSRSSEAPDLLLEFSGLRSGVPSLLEALTRRRAEFKAANDANLLAPQASLLSSSLYALERLGVLTVSASQEATIRLSESSPGALMVEVKGQWQ